MIGTPLKKSATRVMLLGSGELGKEVVLEAQRLGVEVIAVDRYADAPAMQVAHRAHVVNMLDRAELGRIVAQERPHLIVPEIEAIDTPYLLELEREGYTVIPTARAANLTMNREGIRRLAAEELGLPTAAYRFAASIESFRAAVADIGLPCVVKPIMSSSGKGQSVVKSVEEIDDAWAYAMEGGRGASDTVIVEEFIPFDYEITLLTVRHAGGTTFCPPIGHVQIKGDYHESWQPMAMTPAALAESQRQAKAVTDALGGSGIFGVELFIKGDRVWFSEVSPRPHDTGMVTMISQNLSEFELHVRAILGLPVPEVVNLAPAASHVVLAPEAAEEVTFSGLDAALSVPETKLRLFGKPDTRPGRRMGVALSFGADTDEARNRAEQAAHAVRIVTL
ncbi:formate-dependent phosphoribosylglycinamide formyltransferase [Geobacter hydrogenophilus]|uniref:Formate-dependent phosphoribosylglycinamide formyltransferase n=1 Tax=Geobacter hydrogenophilus TaxID=40983 RepID=A0A9W6FZ02_9BACT|nr:formate-dependent phosphoribosylglycinamide formyltransferase [Geobacter hydrogenophilus]MBT0893618.1 formate-dependent phosphoribosylglycinamide formyltransferase [Geobacter hydrogenophilus]GLI37685.1 phosphoribosylglycinamide formyltransferase 2 [Geobacter hydrogenophilus]